MLLGVIGRTGPEMSQVVGLVDRTTERVYFWGEFGAHHCNQWGLTVYVCDGAATRPSSQITLGRLVLTWWSGSGEIQV